jgi:hypothetical protein
MSDLCPNDTAGRVVGMMLENALFDISEFCDGYFMSTFFSEDRRHLAIFFKRYSHLIEVIHGNRARIFRLKTLHEASINEEIKCSNTAIVTNLLKAALLLEIELPVVRQGSFLKIGGQLYFFDAGTSVKDLPRKGVVIVTLTEFVWDWKGAGYEVFVPRRISTKTSSSLVRSFMAKSVKHKPDIKQEGGDGELDTDEKISISDYL